MIEYSGGKTSLSHKSLYGVALEALVGAVYLDKGFVRTRFFIIKQVIKPYIDLELIESTDTNYKNQLLSWAQKLGYSLIFNTLEEKMEGVKCRFTPSCSAYGIEAIKKYGPLKGSRLALKRFLSCHPWGKSGYDPLP